LEFSEQQQIQSFLLPQLQNMMLNPAGFTPAEFADLTAS
jgi:hypothetical protein